MIVRGKKAVMRMIMQKKGLSLKWLCMIKDFDKNDFTRKSHIIKQLYIEKDCYWNDYAWNWLCVKDYAQKGVMIKWLCVEKIVTERIVHDKWLSPKWFYMEKNIC